MKFLYTLVLPATRRRTAWNIRFWIVLVFFTLIASITRAQTSTGFSGFTQSFNPAGSNIVFTTANTSDFFHVGDPIGLATIDGSPLNVFAWYGDLLYSGPATNLYLPAGHYFVEAPGDRNEFAVLPADWSNLTDVGWDSGFWPLPSLLAPASFLKLGWVRGAFEWGVIQAGGSNSWDWTSTDQIINAHYGLRKIEMTLQDAPSWVQDPVTLAWNLSPSQFTQAFAQFAQAVAQRYSNRVDVVEVWNEPNIYTLPGTNVVSLYVNMLAAARAAFPTVKLSGPVLNSGLLIRDVQALASAGAGSYLDYDAYHDYEARSGAPDVAEPTNAAWLTVPQRVQDNFAVFGKPILVDEVGLYGLSALGAPNPPRLPGLVENSGLSWTTGMIYAIKYAVMYAATNNVILMPHQLLSGVSSTTNNDEVLGFDVNGRGPHPKTSAFLMSEYWVNGSTLAGWQSPGTNVFLYAWQRPDNTSIVFAWTTDGQSFPLSTNTTFTITDVYGRSIQPNVLTAQPILFHTNSPNATALLNAVVAALPGSVNLPPVIGFLGNQNVLKNQPLQFTVPAVDPNNYAITYSASPLPIGATLNPTNGVFSWTPGASQTGAYTITFTATDTAGLSASTTILISALSSATDGLVDWWKFDETNGTTAADSAGADPGTLMDFSFNSTSGWTTGVIGGALAFDGVSDYVSLDSSQLNLTNDFSISAWINPRNASGDGVFFCVRSMYQQSGFKFWVDSNDLIVEGQTTVGWNQTYFGVGQIQNNNWYHVVVVYDKSTVLVYLNGVNLAPDYEGSPNWGGDFVMNPSEPTRIGAENGTGPVGFFFDGVIDDLRVYNRTLIPAEVEALYQAADQSPTLAPISAQTVVAGEPLTFSLSASDPNTSNLTYSASALPSGASLNTATGLFSWTPNGTQTGVYDITFTVSDGVLTNSQATTITVSAMASIVTVQASPSNAGTVSGGGTYAVGSQQQLTATPASGWGFTNWSDGNTQNPRTITVPSGGTTYTADFSQATTPITVQVSPSNSGTVSGGGTYAVGSQQQLTATPASGWGFTNWSDGNTQNPRTITVPSGGTTYTADFSQATTPITVQVSPSNSGTVSGGGTFAVGSQQQLTANPASGWGFTNWSDGNTQNPRTITVPSGGTTYTADFSQATTPITVQVSPSNSGTVSGGGTFAVGSQQQLTANPASGWGFTNWSDGNTQNPRTITVPSSGTTYTANFSQQTTSTSGQGGSSNSVSGSGDGATLQMLSAPTVTNAMAQIGSLTVVVAGDTNVFTVDATDSGGITLYYTWTFGDGQTSVRSSTDTSTHVYEDCGPYTASVVVDDGVSSTNASFEVSTACLLGRLGLHLTLNFARTNADSCVVSGTCDLPADYNFTGNVVTLDIAGAEVSFTLNSKRSGVAGLSTFSPPSYNRRTGLWTFNATLRDGSWSTLWNSYGLVNATIPRPGVAVTLPVLLAIDNETFMATANLHYTAVAGRSGTAR